MELWRNDTDRESLKYSGKKLVSATLCSPQILHNLTRDRTWAIDLRVRWLNALALLLALKCGFMQIVHKCVPYRAVNRVSITKKIITAFSDNQNTLNTPYGKNEEFFVQITNKMDQITKVLFCHETLHVSDIFCAYHQELSAVQRQVGTAFQPDSLRQRPHNLHERY
jgi:hypothetical protein